MSVNIERLKKLLNKARDHDEVDVNYFGQIIIDELVSITSEMLRDYEECHAFFSNKIGSTYGTNEDILIDRIKRLYGLMVHEARDHDDLFRDHMKLENVVKALSHNIISDLKE